MAASATRASLCLNMIVKNEMANLPRCLAAVAPYIDCWVIADTGSTDGTQDFIETFFADRGLPGELHSVPFENFGQARNAALDHAYASGQSYDYLLLADADMELVVDDPDFRVGLEAPSYRLLQRSGISYWNVRLVRRDAKAGYHGVTHEYIHTPGGVQSLSGAWYIDHASGSNRVDKFERDIRLLRQALEGEPDNARSWFYLAQSLRDAGRFAEAAETYAKRAEMGGWEEEAWHAKLSQARCLRSLGDHDGFVREALSAFDRRPHRAEPLYDLACFYRERGMNAASLLFAEAGLALPWPVSDSLFIEDAVYRTGLKEEYSIVAYYSPDQTRRDRGFSMCDALALDRAASVKQRDLARKNLRFYVQPLVEMAPSFTSRRVDFTPPDGWLAMNPSVLSWAEGIVTNVRLVNYQLTEAGEYRAPPGEPIRSRNVLVHLDDDLKTTSQKELLPPVDLPAPLYQEVIGFEDVRPFEWRGGLWCLSVVRELTLDGWCEQVLARIEESVDGACRLVDWRVLTPEGPRRHEKNWMPRLRGDRLDYVYLCDPTQILDDQARTVALVTPGIAADLFRGGSQAIDFQGGGLALVHEVIDGATYRDRSYRHRFIHLDPSGGLAAISPPFCFQKSGLEFAAGLAWHPDGERLMVSYGVDDKEAWIATIDAAEVGVLLAPAAAGVDLVRRDQSKIGAR